VLARWLPKRMVSEPAYVFDRTEPDVSVLKVVEEESPLARKSLDKMLESLMSSFGSHSRNFLKTIVK
jgi:hypothetical protein